MIYDKICNIEKYLGISANLDKAIKYVADKKAWFLEIGSHEIDGKNVYVNVMDSKTKLRENAKYEWHEKYFDIQIDLCGEELIDTSKEITTVTKEYCDADDAGLCDAAAVTTIKLDCDTFAIYFPQEPHMPCIAIGNEPKELKKFVVKVRK
ncbi:MAG: YhcH/YjgK/YiaL family protein [Clostridia bacterium]